MKGILEFIKQFFKKIQLPHAFSWTTLFGLSLFSWFMEFFSFIVARASEEPSNDSVRNLLSFCGWIFLILSLDWWTVESTSNVPKEKSSTAFAKFLFGSWLTGTAVTVLIFGVLFKPLTIRFVPLPYVAWPLIAASVAILHRFYPAYVKYKTILDLPKLVILILFNTTLSCLLNFHFVIQGWLEDYPSLLQFDDFERSSFVNKVEANPLAKELSERKQIRGEEMLNALEDYLKQNASNKLYSKGEQVFKQVEKNLKGNSRQSRQLTGQPWKEVKVNLLKKQPNLPVVKPEDNFWYLRVDQDVDKYDYTLKLQALWRGPSPYPTGYQVERNCSLIKDFRTVTQPTPINLKMIKQITVGEVKCDSDQEIEEENIIIDPNNIFNQ